MDGIFLLVLNVLSTSFTLCIVQLFAHVAVASSHSGQVVILTSVSVGSYIDAVSPGDLPACFLRSLATGSFSDVPVAPLLAQPNLVSGLSAQGLFAWHFSFISWQYKKQYFTESYGH